MDFVNIPLFAAAMLVFLSVLAGLFSTRIGFSFLLVFLLAGMMAGVDGPGAFSFDNLVLVFWVGNVALAVILLDGGLRTLYSTFRTGLKPAALLATVGVLISAGITGLAAMWLLKLPAPTAMLLGAIVGSTDAAAVFALLTRSRVSLNERVAATLEIESGLNDPMAVYLTLSCIALVLAWQRGTGLGDLLGWSLALDFMQQFGWGAALGLLAGWLMAEVLKRLAARDANGGILALLLVAGGLSTFAAAGLLQGSGFLAVYLFGLVVANRAASETAPTLAAMDGYAWLAQAGMFLLLGLLLTPSTLLPQLWPSLGLALVLMLVARPLAVWLCLLPFHFSRQEVGFIAWVGLRGAVPIVLALFPLMANVPQAQVLFNAAFVVVVVSLLLQGSSIGWMARRLGVALPDPEDEPQARLAYGDFVLHPQLPLGEVCGFYGLDLPADENGSHNAHTLLADWVLAELRRPPVVGDAVPLGAARITVRTLQDGQIKTLGLRLTG